MTSFLRGGLLVLLFSAVCSAETVALVGATVHADPRQPPIANAVVVIEGDVITVVGPRDRVTIPGGARIVDCTGGTITAGFWNSHVHFTDPQWGNAASLPAAQLSRQLQAMLTRYGFATVFDTGSDLANTNALRARITRGELSGPRILTAGEPLVTKDGTPFYVRPLLPELLTPDQSVDLVRQKLAAGADAIKLHAGTITDERDKDNSHVAIPTDLVRAVTSEAHRQAKPVFAHPQYQAGLRTAIDGDVDVLVHVTEELGPWPRDLFAAALRKRVALIPTLKLLAGPGPAQKANRLVGQVREYSEAGGTIIFGTDVGYIPDYDPTEEYELMAQAGMRPMQILAALTTAPVERFRGGARAGRIAEGFEADLTVLDGDPVADVRNFARVRYTIRAGTFIFSGP
jgi:imidazolonepropionase-like amidohydrolase